MNRLLLIVGCLSLVGCQQKMAEQPAPRPYEQHPGFADKQSARPLEKGVIHRNQPTSDDPMVNWLTPAGKAPKVSAEWKAAVDPTGNTAPTAGAPTSVDNFVTELPFEMTEADLVRGQSLYAANCALCHGGAGYGNGKIVERGFLKPPSYHTDPAGTAMDAGHMTPEGKEKTLPVGYSRGFDRYGLRVAIKDAPIGYIYQVIYWGYGGMASHETQLPNVADRWRVAAYVKTLIYSRSVPAGELPATVQAELNGQTAPKPAKDGNH